MVETTIPITRFRREIRRISRLMDRGHPPIVITVRGIPRYVIQPYRFYRAEVLRAYSARRLERPKVIELLGPGYGAEVPA